MISFRNLIDSEEDYKLIYNWCSKRQVYEWFEQRILSYDEIVNKYKNKIGKQEVLIIEYENIPIGLIQIYKYDGKIDNYKNIYEYDLFIGENLLNKGIGSEVINLINRKIFFELHADLIVLRPFKRNERAIKCYTKCGFKHLYDYDGTDTVGNKEIISVYVKDIERWKFGMDNNKLIELILSGKKTATTSLLSDNISKIGDESIIMYDDNTDACMIRTTDVIVTEFKNINKDLAYLEGEENRSLEYYKKVHNEFFKQIDPNFNDNTKVIFEIFEVII